VTFLCTCGHGRQQRGQDARAPPPPPLVFNPWTDIGRVLKVLFFGLFAIFRSFSFGPLLLEYFLATPLPVYATK